MSRLEELWKENMGDIFPIRLPLIYKDGGIWQSDGDALFDDLTIEPPLGELIVELVNGYSEGRLKENE